MVSRQKYEQLIKKFLNKYEKVMGKELAGHLTQLWIWVKDYNNNMSDKVNIENRKLYVKRGANLMIKFVDSYSSYADSLKDSLLKCRLSLLRGEKTCSEKTKSELADLIREYNKFVQAMIGCNNAGADYILALIERTAEMLGNEYIDIKNKLELKCLNLQKELVQDL
ncbi:MAG TPA: hypothetical protein PKD85_00215 [Saprospiraceae bacterium]|nr:hypothetical protein [Saprospiraceae bacterium]